MDQICVDDSSMAFRVPPSAFLDAPAFDAARDRLIAGKLAVYDGAHLLNRLILEEGRYISYLAALALHAGQDMARPTTWLTLGRLQREVVKIGVASRNRVEAQVSCLRKYGLLTQQVQASDRRVRLLVPGAALLARDAAILGVLVDGLADFGFSPARGQQGPIGAELHRAMRRATLPHLAGLVRRHLPLAPFFAHDCGYLILLLLLRDARQNADGVVAIGHQRLAIKTGVSRTHVRRIVEAACDAGLLAARGRGGHDIRLTDAMWHAADRWFADLLSLTDLLLRNGLQALAAEREGDAIDPG